MDITLKLKRVVATFAAVALFASTASVAIAQTFNDVSTDAWYFDYVEQLVDDGVVDAGDNYRPAETLNRAELAKMVITAIDGLAGYEAPATPTFDDVAVDAWFYDYVEAAVQLGIVNGYTDAVGNLTGMYGPSNTVTRAEATKVLVNAFSVPTDLTPASMFSDVTEEGWYYDYVVTAYNQSIVDGYDNGNFGPADLVTRAQVAKLVVLSQSPVDRVVDEDPIEDPVNPPSEGDLEVSLNDDTAASTTVPQYASSIDLAAFDVTAADDDVEVSQVVVTRGGVGQTSDWDALYLYDGIDRLTTGRTINSDTNTATFAVNLVIEAGTTTTLRLVGDLVNTGFAGSSNQHYFYIASAADVTSNAQAVSGDFPIAGNTFTISGTSTTVNNVAIIKGSAPSQPQIGEADAEIATLKLTAGSTNDVAVHQITLTQAGSLASSKMVNCRLLRSTDEVASTDGFDGDRVTFVLDTPYVIPEGQSKTFYVNCDIDGGRTTDAVSLYLDENTDLVVVDQQFGFGATITNSFGSGATNSLTLKGGDVTVVDNSPAATQIAQNTTNNQVLAFGMTTDRDLTVRDTYLKIAITDTAGNGPVLGPLFGTEAVTGGTNTVITMASTADFEVADMVQVITGTGTEYGLVTVVTPATSITVTGVVGTPTVAQTITEVNPFNYIKNVRLIDVDSATTMAGPMTTALSGATCTTGAAATEAKCIKVHSEDYELTGGDTRHLAVELDLHQNIPANYRIKASVAFGDSTDTSGNSYLKDMAANEYVSASDVVGASTEVSPLGGKWMTSAANSLTVVVSSTPTSYTYVRGDAAVPSLGFSMTSGDAGDITVKRLDVKLFADDGTLAPTVADPFNLADAADRYGNTAANTLVASVTLYDGDDVVAGPKGVTLVNTGVAGYVSTENDYYMAQFDDLNLLIEAGSTKTLRAKVALLNTMTSVTYLALGMNPADMITEDADANTITPVGAEINDPAVVAQHNPLITINTAGTLTVLADGEDAEIVVAGTDMVPVAKYTFSALREGFNINKIDIVDDNQATTVNFGDDIVTTGSVVDSVTIKCLDVYGDLQPTTEAMNSGIASFNNLDCYAPAGEDAYMEVFANINTLLDAGGEIASGQVIRLGIQNINNNISTFEAVGASSQFTLNFDDANPTAFLTGGSSLETFVARKSMPTFAKASSLNTNDSPSATDNRLFGVTVTADANGSISLGRLVFDVSETLGAGAVLDELKFYQGSTKLSGVAAKATIYEQALGNIAEGGAAMANGGGTVIVALLEQITIEAGGSETFYLDADLTGVIPSTGSITTKLSSDDDAVAVAGEVTNTTPNSARVWSSTATDSLLTANTSFVADATTDSADIIWSDRSADVKSYATFTGVLVDDNSSSFDWTNGHLLKVSELTAHAID